MTSLPSPRLRPLHGSALILADAIDRPGDANDQARNCKNALDDGANGVATAGWVSADGVVFLSDRAWTGSRLRRKPITRSESPALMGQVLTLPELYAQIPSSTVLSLDLSSPDAFEPVIAAARHAPEPQTAEKSLYLCTSDLQTARNWRSNTSARIVIVSPGRDETSGLERLVSDLVSAEVHALRMDHREWTGGRVALAHRFGLCAFATGAVHQRELVGLIDGGIDAIYGRDVQAMTGAITLFDHR